MGVLLLCLILHAGLARATHDGYVEWSDGGGDDDDDAVSAAKIDARQHRVRGTERAASPGAGAEELPRVVAAFLHSGDASALEHVNCSRRYELSSLGSAPPAPPVNSSHSVRAALDAVSRAADFLNALARETKQEEKQQKVWYRALVRSMLGHEPKVHRAALTLQTEQLHLQATRMNGHVELRELSGEESEWNRQRTRMMTQTQNSQSTQGHVQWSAPYLECERGRFIPHWLLTLSVKVFGLNSNTEPEIRGVVRVDVSLQDVDIDQCSSLGWFSGTHRCNLTSMECKAIPGHGFVLDKYTCQCRRGFYQHSRVALNGFSSQFPVLIHTLFTTQHTISSCPTRVSLCRLMGMWCTYSVICGLRHAHSDGVCVITPIRCVKITYPKSDKHTFNKRGARDESYSALGLLQECVTTLFYIYIYRHMNNVRITYECLNKYF